MTQGILTAETPSHSKSATSGRVGRPPSSSLRTSQRPGSSADASPAAKSTSVFDHTDYRVFLQAYYEEKRSKNPAFTMSAFTRRAGLGANSRGYLKMIIDGKRNLTPHTLRAFVDALGLGAKEALYFENLVYFNQARTARDKAYYFARLKAASEGRESSQFELLRSQYAYCANWYLVAVRELVGLSEFDSDPAWIASRLRGKITRKQASEALAHLERMGLIQKKNGRFVQTDPLVKIPGEVFNLVLENFHSQMMDLAKEALVSDAYEERNVSGVTLSCDSSRIGAIRDAISRFRDEITSEFGVNNSNPDTVVQINLQLFQLSTPTLKKENSK